MKKFASTLMVLLTCSILSLAQIAPAGINYQAVARDASGNVLTSQNVGLRFTLHATTPSGTIVYRETQSLTTNAFGLFTAVIGTGTVVSGSFSLIEWENANHYLQVELDPAGGTAYTDMGTSQLLAVPYSYAANVSERSLDNHWTANGNDLYNNNTGNVGIGTNSPTHRLEVRQSAPPSGTGVIHSEVSGANSGYAVYGKNDDWWEAIGGYFIGGYEGVAGIVAPTGSQYYHGVYGEAYGSNAPKIGVLGNSDMTGVYGSTFGPGRGQTTYYGPNYDETIGVTGDAQTMNATNGASYGMYGNARNPNSVLNAGMFGYARSATGGFSARNYGVLGVSEGPSNATGVIGIADPGASSFGGYGIEGDVLSGTDQVGVYGYCAGATATDYAGYFQGNLYATSASSGIKAFKIDHPQDPANKYLYHSSVESNEMVNIYRGNVVTDANGRATVDLPAYFETLNKDVTYQLTVVNEFAQAIIGEKVHDNRFVIRTDKPNVEVSWMVTGVRKDPLAEKFRIRDVVEKPASEKGTYLTPELYGKTINEATRKPRYAERKAGNNTLIDFREDPRLKARRNGAK